MIPGIFGLKGMAIAAAVAFFIGGAGGIRLEKRLSDARYYKAVTDGLQAKVKALQGRITTVNAAAANDQARAAEAEARRKEAEDKANELESRVADGSCFGTEDAKTLRRLWAK